jgi:hypothetical protein
MSVDYRLQSRWARSLHQQDELRRLLPATSRPALRPVPTPLQAPKPVLHEGSGTLIELHRTPW